MPTLAVTNTSPSHERDRSRDRLGDAFGDQLGGLLARRRSWHSTVNSSPPKRATTSSGRIAALQAVGDGDEQPVAGRVAEAVVDHLEPVEVEEQHGDAARGSLGVGELAPEPLDEEQAVRADR